MLEKKSGFFFGIGFKPCVSIGIETFMIREGEDELPKEKAWCRNCAKESAKVVFPIHMHGRPGYALECTKCGNSYHMYQSMFRTRYVGHTTPSGGHYAPTHGVLSLNSVMDRKAKEFYNSIPERVEKEVCEMTGISKEEYREMKKGWDEKDRKLRKQIERDKSDLNAKIRDEKIKRESNERKSLIEQGILKYVKGVGLVNTETNQVVKL